MSDQGTGDDPDSRQVSRSMTGREAKPRRNIRYFAALVSGVTAGIYFLIGFNVLSVLDTSTDQIFGIFAGVAYGLGTILLIVFDRRVVWVLGAALQVFVIYTYFNLASQRSPAYEVWGMLIRVTQLVILIALAYLAVRWSLAQTAGAGGSRS
jgi:hypothetical protein